MFTNSEMSLFSWRSSQAPAPYLIDPKNLTCVVAPFPLTHNALSSIPPPTEGILISIIEVDLTGPPMVDNIVSYTRTTPLRLHVQNMQLTKRTLEL